VGAHAGRREKALEQRATEVSKQRDAWLLKNAKKTISFDDERGEGPGGAGRVGVRRA